MRRWDLLLATAIALATAAAGGVDWRLGAAVLAAALAAVWYWLDDAEEG
jgi:hypothetical protein